MQILEKYKLTEKLTENRIEIVIIIGTIVLYNFFGTKIVSLMPDYVSRSFYLIILLPGLTSAIAYTIVTKKFTKAPGVGILTIILYLIWFITLLSLGYTIT